MNVFVLSKVPRIQEFLKKKLLQYLSRMFDAREREDIRRDASYKACLVTKLLNEGEVEYVTSHYTLNVLSNGTMDHRAYDEAWKVINDYNRTGGIGVQQRTDQRVRV